MQLRIATPAAICIDRPVLRILAEAPAGFFGMRPGHGDFVTQLVPGILTYVPEDDSMDHYVAINSGTLVKCGDLVRVAVHGAVEGTDLDHLQEQVKTLYHQQDEQERSARTALARLELAMIQRFSELEKIRP